MYVEHKGTKTIETKRLVLRKFKMDDIESSYRNWTSDARVTKYLRWVTHESMDVTSCVLQNWIQAYTQENSYQWAIVHKESNQVIGTISVVDMNEELDIVHIGYCIGSAWWHQGYTSEALRYLLFFFFEEVGVNRLESQHDPNNPHSGEVMKKCGLVYEGTLRQYDVSNQGIVDACMYSMVKEEYFANKERSSHEGLVYDRSNR